MKTNDQAFLICSALIRLGTRMATGFDQRFADLGVSQAQFRIMLAIRDHGDSRGVSPSTLANQLLIERGTMSVLSNRLVEKGWLERMPGENRRSLRLSLTSRGSKLLDKVFPRSIELANQILVEFSRAQQNAFQANLNQIEARMRENDKKFRKERALIKYFA